MDGWVSVLGVAPLISIKAICCYSNRILYDDIYYGGRKAAKEHNSRIMPHKCSICIGHVN